MSGYNKVVLIGNLTRNPELRYTPNGTPVAHFGFAVNRRFRQGDELKEEVTFLDIVVFGKAAENAGQYLLKGSKILVDGRLQQRRWETDAGEKRSKIEVVGERIQYLDNKQKHDGEDQGENQWEASGGTGNDLSETGRAE